MSRGKDLYSTSSGSHILKSLYIQSFNIEDEKFSENGNSRHSVESIGIFFNTIDRLKTLSAKEVRGEKVHIILVYKWFQEPNSSASALLFCS